MTSSWITLSKMCKAFNLYKAIYIDSGNLDSCPHLVVKTVPPSCSSRLFALLRWENFQIMPYIYFFWGRTIFLKMVDQVSDVSSDWVHSLSLFCPQLSSLTISRWTVSLSLHSNDCTFNVQFKPVQHTKSEITTPLTTVQVRTWRWVGCLHCHSSQSPQSSTFPGCHWYEPRANFSQLLCPSHQIFSFPRFPPSPTLDSLSCLETCLSFVASVVAIVLEK